MARNSITPDGRSLYESDYYSWALRQARALKARRAEELDWENLCEEVEDLARSEKRGLRNRLRVLLDHLLKWQFHPARRSRTWEATLAVQRAEIRQLLRDSPGLQPLVSILMDDAYETARAGLAARLGERSKLPASCPWRFEQVMDEQFRPG